VAQELVRAEVGGVEVGIAVPCSDNPLAVYELSATLTFATPATLNVRGTR
jgi:hypothetical protein